MSGLDLGQAPPPVEPWRFLRSSLIWGVVAGAWWLWQGEWALTSRWAPPTLVSVHAWVLGVLGNAMLGSLLQFLPVAANTRLSLPLPAKWLHRGFNLGVVALLLFFLMPHTVLGISALLLLAGSLGVFALRSLLALHAVIRVGALQRGIAMSLWFLLATVVLGGVAAMVLTGHLPIPLERIVNLHAALGLGGWCVGLLAAVGAVTVPMFQGARVLTRRAQRIWGNGWRAAMGLTVLAATARQADGLLMLGIGLPCAELACMILWMQVRSPHPRNLPLRLAWRLGAFFLWLPLLLPLVLPLMPVSATSPAASLVAGTAVVVAGLPLLMLGMQLEIVPFLAWIELRQRHPRGVRVPGVGRLLDSTHKQRLLLIHVAAAVAALIATFAARTTVIAGVLIMLAYAGSLLRFGAVWRNARAWQPAPESPRSQ